MSRSLLNNDISPACEYCIHGKSSEYSDEIFCIKNGVTNKNDSCRHYKYDVLKRKPHRIKPSGEYSAEDFKL